MSKIAIAGAGAMGSRFTAMLLESGNEVTVIDAWPAHIQIIQNEGLTVEYADGKTRKYHLPAFLPEDVDDEFDLIILFTKAMQMDDMLSSIQHVIRKKTYLLTLSNGIGNIETIQKYAHNEQIIAGVTLWSSELIGPGKIKVTGAGSISLQAISLKIPKKNLNKIVQILNDAGLNASLADDVLTAIWKKAAFNSVINTMCALLNCNVGQFGQLNNHQLIIDSILSEFEIVAQAEGLELDKNEIKRILENQFDPSASGNHYPSMYQDIKNGRPTEIDYLNGYITKLGAKHDIPTPVNTLITALIHSQEQLSS